MWTVQTVHHSGWFSNSVVEFDGGFVLLDCRVFICLFIGYNGLPDYWQEAVSVGPALRLSRQKYNSLIE